MPNYLEFKHLEIVQDENGIWYVPNILIGLLIEKTKHFHRQVAIQPAIAVLKLSLSATQYWNIYVYQSAQLAPLTYNMNCQEKEISKRPWNTMIIHRGRRMITSETRETVRYLILKMRDRD